MKTKLFYFALALFICCMYRVSAQQGESEYKSVKINAKAEKVMPSSDDVALPDTKEATACGVLSDIDSNIPKNNIIHRERYALIIGNEDYHTHQTTLNYESDVEFAARDACIFKEYALNTLGIPEENILFKIDAGQIEMKRMFDKINLIMKYSGSNSEIFVYYAGHGFPDVSTRVPYIIPVDVSVNDLKYAVKLEDIYTLLSEYPGKRVTVFFDACFSGGGRNLGLLAARAVRLTPKEEIAKGNLVVFSASSEEQPALSYQKEKHGLFTYFLLKKLKETNGDVSYDELSEYLGSEVPIKSIMINNMEQTPKIYISQTLGDEWKAWKMK